ncbi:MAG TPA: BamA/TamA family outer membrane protein [Usitatibacter sp.]|nr:BamA/TamA family outer membrane protein [Usitatibacter sp.]
MRELFERFLPPPRRSGDAEKSAELRRPWVQDVRKRVPEIAASEGYFSPTLDVRFDESRDHATVKFDPGPLTRVGDVDISFEGDLAGEGEERERRRARIREGFAMKPGQAFRSADWESAKTGLEQSLTDRDYAAGTLLRSRADVDEAAATARLTLVLASGPPFTFGEVTVLGLERYPEGIVRRLVNIRPGERYSRERLEQLQRLVQAGPWFSSVVAEIDPDPATAERAPVKLTVVERAARDAGLSFGYGTDDGLRAEATYRDRDFLGRAFDLQSSIKASQKQQIGYADVYLPPGIWTGRWLTDMPYKDSVGVLTEHSIIEDNNFTRLALAAYRHWYVERFELQAGLSYQVEKQYPTGAPVNYTRALAPVVTVTWRPVDSLFDPKRGGVLNVQLAAGSRSLGSGEDFLKAYMQYQCWYPIAKTDQLLLRIELGRTFAQSREGIPDDFLFTAGGSRSNRGYAYQSLGVQQGSAVVGGRYLETGTVEYVHWLDNTWGAAAFMDVGTAADSPEHLDALKSYGVGARYRTPAGPFALDLAYADRDRKLRLSFSVSIAF